MISNECDCRVKIVLFPLQYLSIKVVIFQMPHFLDLENIFPKRLGIMNGNTLVVQYYDLGRDKFKKHPIPFNPLQEVKSIIDQIYKNVRHIPFIKKIDPKHLKSVLQGQSILPKRQQVQQQKKPNFQKFAQILTKNQDKKWKQDKLQESIDKSNILSISQTSNKGAGKGTKPQEIDDQYAEEFQQFQISQSIDKSKNISISNIQKSKPSQSQGSSKSKFEPQSSSFSKQQKSQVESSSSFSKAQDSVPVKKVIEQVIEEEYADDFQFVDEPKQEEKKKEKKQKKDKSKSKQKKPKKEKKDKVPKVQTKQVQEQFQFL